MKATRMARILALGAGAADFCTGLGLVFAPALLVRVMGVVVPAPEALVFLRWDGAFVGAVGAVYVWSGWRSPARLRAMLELTLFFRLAAGGFSAVAIARGWLAPAWLSVPVTDLILAAVQAWLLMRGAGRDD